MHSFLKLSSDKQSCSLSQLYLHEMVYKYSTIYTAVVTSVI